MQWLKTLRGDIGGAFADGAVLFPLLAALTWQTKMDGSILLASAGLVYLVAGYIYQVPMSVQPLKSVVITALAINASAIEIQLSGLCVGLVCLALSFFPADRLAAKVPRHLVHGLQLGLGVLLMLKGLQWGTQDGYASSQAFLFVLLTLVLLVGAAYTQKPLLGWIATAGLGIAMMLAIDSPEMNAGKAAISKNAGQLRPDIMLALILPQLALTLTNSVVATEDVARRYFGEQARYVRPVRLLRSIGGGNCVIAAIGGLPFCHGSGGITAHYKGGGRTWHMNCIIGGTLLALAGLSALTGVALIPAYPRALMATLVFAIGFYHVQLAAPSWAHRSLRWILLVMGTVALVSQNMLWTLAGGIACAVLRHIWRHYHKRPR